MSLINQALHKAQRDRTPNRMSQPGEQSPSAYASSAASGMSPGLVIGLVIAVAVLIGLVVGLSVVLFKGDSTPPPQQVVSTATPVAPAPTAPTTSVAPQITQATHPAARPAQTVAAPEPTVVDELRKVREAAEAEAAAQAKLVADNAAAEAKLANEAATRAAAKPSQDIITWLGSAKLSGVRISETESKAIINGNAYSVGEFVNFKLGLKVMIIQEQRVLFIDSNGKKYMKRL